MTFLSIKKQITKIVQTLAYKAYGFNIHYPESKVQLVVNKEEEKIGYKISIPNLIYKKYSEDGFIYSDPGTTPKLIAEDILVHFKSLNHLEMQSDEFGNTVAYLQPEFFEDKVEQFQRENKIRCLEMKELSHHHNETLKLSKKDYMDKNIVMILFRKNKDTINLSELRQQIIFESITNIQKNIFNRKLTPVNIFTSSLKSKKSFEISNEAKESLGNFSLTNHELFYGCELHEVINKEAILEDLLNLKFDKLEGDENEGVKLFKFGIVVPENNFLKINKGNLLEQDEMNKLKRIYYDFPIHKPINLTLIKETNSHFIESMSKKLQIPQTVKELLLKIDELTSENRINELYHIYLVLETVLKSHSQNNLEKSKEKTQYFSIAKITKDYLEKIFF